MLLTVNTKKGFCVTQASPSFNTMNGIEAFTFDVRKPAEINMYSNDNQEIYKLELYVSGKTYTRPIYEEFMRRLLTNVVELGVSIYDADFLFISRIKESVKDFIHKEFITFTGTRANTLLDPHAILVFTQDGYSKAFCMQITENIHIETIHSNNVLNYSRKCSPTLETNFNYKVVDTIYNALLKNKNYLEEEPEVLLKDIVTCLNKIHLNIVDDFDDLYIGKYSRVNNKEEK